ncbi:MAG: mechanosensitive ion channel domain-containing protein [Tunicatimonas sp.]
MEDFNVASAVDEITALAALYIPKLLLAILTLIIGLALIKRIVKYVRKQLSKRDVDPSLVPFLSGIIRAILVVMLVISVAGMVGVATTSFVAVLGAAGLAIGLALQGSLSNFAGGVLILLLKPFRVGDVIEAQGVTASVKEIQIFHTIMKSFDNKTIIVPNGPLANDKIINYSVEQTRLVEWTFGIGYSDDIDQARQVIKDIVYNDPRVVAPDEQFINLAELGDSSVNLKVRARVVQGDYWSVFFEVNEAVKKAFDREGITIPFPQVDSHVFQGK